MRLTLNPFGIYPILDAQWLEQAAVTQNAAFSPDQIAQHLSTLPIEWIQLRCKDNERQAQSFITSWMQPLRHHCPKIKILINDHVELALALKADGVHVGQNDQSVAFCRRLLGEKRLIGLSTHSLEEVRVAETLGVDYVGFGPIFATQTKQDTQCVQGLDILATLTKATRLPIVAIGGITMDRILPTAKAGAQVIAMISDLWGVDWRTRLTQACRIWEESTRSTLVE